MEITLNGQSQQIPDDFTAAALIEMLNLTGKRIAMEVNRDIVPSATFAEHRFRPGDKVEIIHAIGGG